MRNKALRKKDPQRGQKIRALRRARSEGMDGTNTVFSDREGNEFSLNLMKHFLMQRPYKRDEFQKELNRYAKANISGKGVAKVSEEES